MKYIPVIAGLAMLASCGGGTGQTAASDSANATQHLINTGSVPHTDSADINLGARLIATNDCLTCHKIEEKSTGPAYKQIADKYDFNQGNIENLATAVIKGSRGLWGQAVMTPHPNVTYSEAEAMCRYILSLKNSADSLK
ncbi:c-type cytochrome [Parafilimonas sp.]|uniref:c-type cytochrome n=1 Tax=Parafilimonas sp. TaxID=1969739 RepID=UPI0039E216C0